MDSPKAELEKRREYLLRIFNEVVEAPNDPVLTAQYEATFDYIIKMRKLTAPQADV